MFGNRGRQGQPIWRFCGVMLASAALAACVSAPEKPKPIPPKPVERPVQPPVVAPKPKPQPYRVTTPPSGFSEAIKGQWQVFSGKTGIAVQRIDDGGWLVGERLGEYFPQQSVSKLWVAMTVLDQVDRGKIRLDQKVHIGTEDLAVFHQPIRTRVLANDGIDESVMDLLEQAMAASDNTANDSLLRLAGGPEAVRAFLVSRNLNGIRFGPGERLLQSSIAGVAWKQEYSRGDRFEKARAALPLSQRKAALDAYLADPLDGATPTAVANALSRLARGELLSDFTTRMLLQIMSRSTSGPNRLKAGVPYDWQFMHKTGTGQVLSSVSTGYNDVGIMTAPDGTRYAVVVMIGSTTVPIPERMTFMQSISRATANYHRK